MVWLCFASSIAQTPSFEKVGASEGLSQGMIYALLQDRRGFLWFATKGGLNRYDGYSFQVFQNDPFNPFSISDNEVKAVLEDRLGRIWTGGSNNGLNIFDPTTGKFYQINKLVSQNIGCLAETKDGAIWAGSVLGLNRIRIPDVLPADEPSLDALASVTSISLPPNPINKPANNNEITDLKGSADGQLWISRLNQVGYLDPKTEQYQTVWRESIDAKNPQVSHFFEALDGTIWAGQIGQLLRIRGKEIATFPFPEPSVFPYTAMALDASGNLFVSTRKQIFKLPDAQNTTPESAKFQLFYRFPTEGVVGSTKLLVDRSGLLWIGTNGYGLLKHNPGNPSFHHYAAGKSPRRILCDHEGNTWVWQAGGGFLLLNESDRHLSKPLFNHPRYLQHDCIHAMDGSIWLLTEDVESPQTHGTLFRINPSTLQTLSQYPVSVGIGMFSQIKQAKDGTFWILGDQGVLAQFDPGTNQTTLHDYSGITGFKEPAYGFWMDANHHFWIGTPHGLVQGISKADGLKFALHKNNPKDRQSLNCNSILSLFESTKQPGILWIGTNGGGLNRMDKTTGKFKHYTQNDGLPNHVVYGILPDSTGALWLSTNNGLSKFDPKAETFQNYFSVDGLQDNEFNTLSYAQNDQGRLFFGGVNGITAFYPWELSASSTAPPVLITQLKINSQPASVDNGLLQYSIEQTQSLTLNYSQNQLSFEFAAMDFSAPRMNQFKYRLLGANEEWVEATNSNSATYAHLQPGHYVFEVKTGGSRGIWNGAPVRLEIHILPPWWRTGWAYFSYVLMLSLAVWSIYRFQLNKIRLENKLAFEHRETLRLAELDRLKTNFFSSVTHEFRTPLTLLLEPARQLLLEAKDQAQRYRLELIEKNARRLLQFVHQLLDLSKLEAGQMPLHLHPGYPAKTIEGVVEQFQTLAQQRSIQLQLDLIDSSQPVVFDEIKWEQIVSNLLSNALKFTPESGRITLKLSAKEDPSATQTLFKLEVTDTGIGISATDLPRIFDRFYQVAPTVHTPQEREAVAGTGIGLALTKELVERMGGTIVAKSPFEAGKGTRFIVMLPCGLAQTPVAQAPAPIAAETAVPPRSAPILAPYSEPALDRQSASPLLLLIEDDTELRQFLRASLPAGYRIAEAVNGAEGIQMALELIPDLVISDLVMPLKNGFEVAEALKKHPSCSHIPIILLTAKSALDAKMEGLSRGADVYLTKPFRADELVAHIENLLASRRLLQALFSAALAQQAPLESAVSTLPEEENALLLSLIEVIEKNLDNEAMDAEAFARAVFISRSQLHRKIIALTGLSLTEFVRNYRLDRAKVLLSQREGSISEIAWRTGFPNAKYFSTCFKERFGVTPSAFIAGA